MSSAIEAEAFGRRLRLWITAGPGMVWIMLFLLLPCAVLLGIGFMSANDYGKPELPLSFDAFSNVAGFTLLGWDSSNIFVLLRSLEQAVIATLISAALAYPLVFFILICDEAIRPILLLLLILPSWTNQVVRTYAWLELFSPDAPLSRFVQHLGLLPPHLGLAPGGFAVATGLAYNYLPYMIVPLYTTCERIDWRLIEAGQDLFASGWSLFRHAVFPQTLPGLLSGIIFVAIPAFGDYVVPQMLGGDKVLMMGSLIAGQFTETPNWPYGAALTLIMLFLTGLGLIGFRLLSRRIGGGEEAAL